MDLLAIEGEIQRVQAGSSEDARAVSGTQGLPDLAVYGLAGCVEIEKLAVQVVE